jgi:hypothetical protein
MRVFMRRTSRSERAPALAALALVFAGCALLAVEARHLTFNGDDWVFVLDRRGTGPGVLLRPYNEHLMALPILGFKVLLQVFGGRSYAPFIALLLIVHAVACLLLYAVARRCVGPWLALIPTAILVVLGPAWQDLLWACNVAFVGAVAAGLGTILVLDRRDRLGDWAAAALLCVSLLCTSVGVAMVLLAAVLLVLERPRNWRRLWIVLVPAALYAAWYAGYGESGVTGRLLHRNLQNLPSYVPDALAAALGSVTGLAQVHGSTFLVSVVPGRVLAVAIVLGLIVHRLRGGVLRVPPLAWAAGAAALTLWVGACMSEILGGREPNQNRYQYAAVALVLLVVLALAARSRVPRWGGAVLAAVAVLICASNIALLHRGAAAWRQKGEYTTAITGALTVARDHVSPTFQPEDFGTGLKIGNFNLLLITAGPYLSAADDFGSIADSPRDILRRPERVRQAVDLVLGRAEHLRLGPAAGIPSEGARCRTAASGAGLGEIAAGPATIVLQVAPGHDAQLQVRRFASGFRFLRFGGGGLAGPRLDRGTPLALRLPRDRARLPWRMRVSGGRAVRLCVVDAS